MLNIQMVPLFECPTFRSDHQTYLVLNGLLSHVTGLFIKYQRSGVSTQDLSSMGILKVGDLSRVKAE